MASQAGHDRLREVVERARDRDPDAWEELYRRGYSKMFAYARRRTAHDAAADDAVSETMTRALEKIDRYTWQGAGFDAWLFGILRLVVLEHGRRAHRDLLVDPDRPLMAPADTDPAVIAQTSQRARDLRESFVSLSAEDREVLELRVVAGLSAEAVAEVTGKQPGAVRMAQSRALSRLRERMRQRHHA